MALEFHGHRDTTLGPDLTQAVKDSLPETAVSDVSTGRLGCGFGGSVEQRRGVGILNEHFSPALANLVDDRVVRGAKNIGRTEAVMRRVFGCSLHESQQGFLTEVFAFVAKPLGACLLNRETYALVQFGIADLKALSRIRGVGVPRG